MFERKVDSPRQGFPGKQEDSSILRRGLLQLDEMESIRCTLYYNRLVLQSEITDEVIPLHSISQLCYGKNEHGEHITFFANSRTWTLYPPFNCHPGDISDWYDTLQQAVKTAKSTSSPNRDNQHESNYRIPIRNYADHFNTSCSTNTYVTEQYISPKEEVYITSEPSYNSVVTYHSSKHHHSSPHRHRIHKKVVIERDYESSSSSSSTGSSEPEERKALIFFNPQMMGQQGLYLNPQLNMAQQQADAARWQDVQKLLMNGRSFKKLSPSRVFNNITRIVQDRFVFLSNDGSLLCWAPLRKMEVCPAAKSYLPLQSIFQIAIGVDVFHGEAIFGELLTKRPDTSCIFSFISPGRIITLQASTAEECMYWASLWDFYLSRSSLTKATYRAWQT